MVSYAPSRSGTRLSGSRCSIPNTMQKDLQTKVKPGSIASSDSSDWHTLSFLENKGLEMRQIQTVFVWFYVFFFRFCFWVFRMHVALFESKFPDILCNWILSRGAQQSLRVWSATSARISIFIFAAFSCFLVSWALFMSHKKPKTNPRDTFPIPKTPALSRGRWKWRTACNLCQIW